MLRSLRLGAVGALLAGPVVLAFVSGGYFALPRDAAGIGASLLLAVGALTAASIAPRRRRTQWTLATLWLLAGWTLLSTVWAPIAGDAFGRGELVVIYAVGLCAAWLLLRGRAVRVVEPAVAFGAVIVVGYGLSERLLPGLLHFARSVSAGGRLEQPLTYWNAMGELAAIGLVLTVRLAGEPDRAPWLRLASTAAAVPLGAGLYISFSRGALFALVAGLIALVVLDPGLAALRGSAIALVGAVLGGVASAPFTAITSLTGSAGSRERQGLIVLVLLAAIALAATAAHRWLARRPLGGRLALPSRAPLIAGGLICVGLTVSIVVGAKESSVRPLGTGAARLETLQSNRYAYWRVALHGFAAEPIRGVGAGGWAVLWLQRRPVAEFAADAHSLPLQTMAELGLVGVALLAGFVGGTAACARVAIRRAPSRAAGPVAGWIVYLAHSPLDWDWEMPAVTLVALSLAGVILVLGDGDGATAGPYTAAVPEEPA